MKKKRNDLIMELMGRTGLKHTAAAHVVASFIDVIKKNLQKGETIQIVGFGSFGTKKRKARTGRNPKTGEEIYLKEKIVPYFKPGSALKAAVKEMKIEPGEHG